MPILTDTFDVTEAAQLLLEASATGEAVEVVNPLGSVATVYVGGAGVTAADGRPIAPGDAWSMDLLTDDELYIVGDAPTTIRYLRVTLPAAGSVDGYLTLDAFKATYEIDRDDDDATIERAIRAASRAIDRATERFFYPLGDGVTPAVIEVTPTSSGLIRADIVSLAEVATDEDDDGTFETVWDAAEFKLERADPLHGVLYPYVALRTAKDAGRSFPTTRSSSRLTGVFGWPAVPDDIVQATQLLAARLYKRKDSAFATTQGTPELGVVTITAADPDVGALIEPFRAFSGLA